MVKERSAAPVWSMILIMTTVLACVVKGVGVGLGSVAIAVVISCVTSTTSAVVKDFGVPIVSRQCFGVGVVLADMADIPSA